MFGFAPRFAHAFGPNFAPVDAVLDSWLNAPEASAKWQCFSPPVDVRETADGYRIEVDLPGMTEQDVKVTLEGRQLTIQGERKAPEEGQALRQERGYGRFERTFQLPDDIDVGRVHAKSKNGILTLTLPRSEEAKAKTIAVVAE